MKQIYYWLDLLGPNGQPAQTKVLVFLTQMVMLGVVPWLVPAPGSGPPSAGFLWYVGLILVAPYGLDGFKSLWKFKAGGLDIAVTESERQRANTILASRNEIKGWEATP